jgi:hypothetical protein
MGPTNGWHVTYFNDPSFMNPPAEIIVFAICAFTT